MDGLGILGIILAIAAVQAAIWIPIILRLRRNAAQFPADLQSRGERLVLGPMRADYQGWTRRFGAARTMGTMALSDRSLHFRRPFGREIVIPLEEVADVSDTATFGRTHHRSSHYICLKLTDGSQPVFFVGDNAPWIREIGGRMALHGAGRH